MADAPKTEQGELGKLDATPLVERLIAQTVAGKLKWEPTADRQAFVSSVGGQMTFKMRMVTETGIGDYGQPESFESPRLDMLDEKGKTLWKIEVTDVQKSQTATLYKLYELAQRVGNKLDERLASAIRALENL